MESRERIKKLVIAAVLTAITMIIPLQFGFLRVNIPPFTATIAAHVPLFLAMLVSPMVGLIVGAASTVGFLLTTPLVVAARAASHIVVGFIGGLIIVKRKNFLEAMLITMPIHALIEGGVVFLFLGHSGYYMALITVIGTMIHHSVDATISYVLAKSLATANKKDLYSAFEV